MWDKKDKDTQVVTKGVMGGIYNKANYVCEKEERNNDAYTAYDVVYVFLDGEAVKKTNLIKVFRCKSKEVFDDQKKYVVKNGSLQYDNEGYLIDEGTYESHFETNQNKVKSMFPHLKEAITTTNEEKEKFKQYTYKDEDDKEVKLIKSRLPFKRGLKFGLSNLKVNFLAIGDCIISYRPPNFNFYKLLFLTKMFFILS